MFNKVILMGLLTADPELRMTVSGLPVCTVTVAVERRTADKQTDFFKVVAWRKTAEFVAKYFSKGKPLGVEGTLQTETWTDKQGVKHRDWQVVAEKVFFCEGKAPAREKPAEEEFQEMEPPDDLPF